MTKGSLVTSSATPLSGALPEADTGPCGPGLEMSPIFLLRFLSDPPFNELPAQAWYNLREEVMEQEKEKVIGKGKGDGVGKEGDRGVAFTVPQVT